FTIVNDKCAKCKICEGKYSHKGKGTTSLKNHLQRKHPQEYALFIKEDSSKKSANENVQQETSLQTVKTEFRQTFFNKYIEKVKMWDNTNPKSIKIDYLIAEMIALFDLRFQHTEELGNCMMRFKFLLIVRKLSTSVHLPFLIFLSSLKNELDYHFSEIDKNILFQLAAFLDPCYKGKFFSCFLIKDIKQKSLTALETEVNIRTTTISTEKPNAVRKEHCNNLEDSMANTLDGDNEDEESENQISYTNANLLTEYAKEKRL
ncbi:uncharacterized protein, partial [Centruroides vittatus]|uniref:uncharacterized protein n=1 Tax=Centruroides vittatus TaxID=120091 RepID=UPI00350FAF96